MVPCARCYRHVRASDARCPFCDAAARPGVSWERVGAGVLLAMAASAALHACYGAPAPCRGPDCDYDRDASVDASADASADR